MISYKIFLSAYWVALRTSDQNLVRSMCRARTLTARRRKQLFRSCLLSYGCEPVPAARPYVPRSKPYVSITLSALLKKLSARVSCRAIKALPADHRLSALHHLQFPVSGRPAPHLHALLCAPGFTAVHPLPRNKRMAPPGGNHYYMTNL